MARPPSETETKSFTIVLPADAAESLEILVKKSKGSYGATRAEAAKLIILQHIRALWESGKLPE